MDDGIIQGSYQGEIELEILLVQDYNNIVGEEVLPYVKA
jgi:hypothetical protein